MINIIDIPTEQTTAATDLLLAIVTIFLAGRIYKLGNNTDTVKGRIWSAAYALLAIAAAFGAVAHGFQMSSQLNFILWQPLNLSLGIVVALFVVGVVYDLKRFVFPRRLFLVMLSLAIIFYLITVLVPGSFLVFIVYEALAMLFSLLAYIFMAAKGRLKGASLMAAGVFVSIVAAGIQACECVNMNLYWEFDHNGVFHMVQLAGLFILFVGLRKEMLLRKS